MLVVEPDSMQRSVLAALFQTVNRLEHEKLEYRVGFCSSASAAVELLRRHRDLVDLVLLDTIASRDDPDSLSGRDALPQIREMLPSDAAIVMLSAESDTATVQHCMHIGGADAYLSKPLRIDELRLLWQFPFLRRGRPWRRLQPAQPDPADPARRLPNEVEPRASEPQQTHAPFPPAVAAVVERPPIPRAAPVPLRPAATAGRPLVQGCSESSSQSGSAGGGSWKEPPAGLSGEEDGSAVCRTQ